MRRSIFNLGGYNVTPFQFRKAVLERIAREREEAMEQPGRDLPRISAEPIQQTEARRAAVQRTRRAKAAREGRELQARYGVEGYERVAQLKREGHSTTVIMVLTGMSRSTVCRILRACSL